MKTQTKPPPAPRRPLLPSAERIGLGLGPASYALWIRKGATLRLRFGYPGRESDLSVEPQRLAGLAQKLAGEPWTEILTVEWQGRRYFIRVPPGVPVKLVVDVPNASIWLPLRDPADTGWGNLAVLWGGAIAEVIDGPADWRA